MYLQLKIYFKIVPVVPHFSQQIVTSACQNSNYKLCVHEGTLNKTSKT